MTNAQKLHRNLEEITWGTLLIWWGITELAGSLPDGTTALGMGLILLGVNGARSLKGIPTNGFGVTIGILALVWGGLELAGAFFSLPFELPVFAILLIVLGVTVLARELTRSMNQ